MFTLNELDTITIKPDCIGRSGGKVSWQEEERTVGTNIKFANSGCASACVGGS